MALACADHVSRADLQQRIQDGDAPPILDVRSRGEYEAAHVPEAVHVPFYSILFRRDEIPRREGEPLVVYCAHGPRAGIARAQLFAAGIGPVVYLEGHMTAWTRDGLPTRSGPGE
jgi:rhodanese-related sulfurtransferase